jgi:hypothetical protein
MATRLWLVVRVLGCIDTVLVVVELYTYDIVHCRLGLFRASVKN